MSVEDRNAALVRDLRRALERTDGEGQRIFSDDDIRHVLPLLLLPGVGKGLQLGAKVSQLMIEFFVMADIFPDTAPAEVGTKVDAFYQRFPPHPALIAELKAWMREHLGGDAGARARALGKVLGQELPSVKLSALEPAPAGSVRGGLYAQMLLRGPSRKS